MTTEEIQNFLQQEFPENPLIVESCENRRARLRLEVDQTHLRPGGTISGPRMCLSQNGTYVHSVKHMREKLSHKYVQKCATVHA